MGTLNWNEFIKGIADLNSDKISHKEITNIKCPQCGEFIYKICDMIFTSYPPKHKYICEKCGWSDFA